MHHRHSLSRSVKTSREQRVARREHRSRGVPAKPLRPLRRPLLAALSPPLSAVDGNEIEPVRGGDDTRRRGWFWHWNSIVTQYAPLIGLKGVGLLNSYTVWTDRREESPHRGFAFPSQQSEADFYGEDRAELITINKMLVALDLIEIRKEMVLRVDEQGRRWKVPHNFYRVKDHGDGFGLNSRGRAAGGRDWPTATAPSTATSVTSSPPKFSPIDQRQCLGGHPGNEVRQMRIGQRLTERTTLTEETRASNRTRAGHEARKGRSFLPSGDDNPTPGNSSSDSDTVKAQTEKATSVAKTNNGSPVDVEASNNGSALESASSVEPVNQARATTVAPANTTKNQYSLLTTTTTNRENLDSTDERQNEENAAGMGNNGTVEMTASSATTAILASSGPGGKIAPGDAPGESAAIQAFEDANGRPSTPAERHLLRGLAAQAEPDANQQGGAQTSGWSWVTAATYEAVEAGSSFVAPRRLREIIRDGRGMVLRFVAVAGRSWASHRNPIRAGRRGHIRGGA